MRALLDLLLPAACAGCGAPGDLACRSCVAALSAPAVLRWPTPPPDGLPPPFAVAAYDGPVRRLVVAYKDRELAALRGVLAAALASSVAAGCDRSVGRDVCVVPVPSTRGARRRRGGDPVAELAGDAVRRCRSARIPARLRPVLEHTRTVHDSVGLSATARATNLSGALRVRPRTRLPKGSAVVLVDDVVTTGATLAEAARALRAHDIPVVAAAVVAATSRHR